MSVFHVLLNHTEKGRGAVCASQKLPFADPSVSRQLQAVIYHLPFSYFDAQIINLCLQLVEKCCNACNLQKCLRSNWGVSRHFTGWQKRSGCLSCKIAHILRYPWKRNSNRNTVIISAIWNWDGWLFCCWGPSPTLPSIFLHASYAMSQLEYDIQCVACVMGIIMRILGGFMNSFHNS